MVAMLFLFPMRGPTRDKTVQLTQGSSALSPLVWAPLPEPLQLCWAVELGVLLPHVPSERSPGPCPSLSPGNTDEASAQFPHLSTADLPRAPGPAPLPLSPPGTTAAYPPRGTPRDPADPPSPRSGPALIQQARQWLLG